MLSRTLPLRQTLFFYSTLHACIQTKNHQPGCCPLFSHFCAVLPLWVCDLWALSPNLAGLLAWGMEQFLCSPGRSTSSVGDIRALSPELVGLYITLDGIVGSRGDSEPPIEHRTIKNCGDGQPNLGIGWTYRQRCRKLPITIRKWLWWSTVIS